MADYNTHRHTSTEQVYHLDTLVRPQHDINSEDFDERTTDAHPQNPQSEDHLLQGEENETTAGMMSTQKLPIETSATRLALAWFPEIFASVLSVGILIALAMVLSHYNGSTLADIDLPNGLTLNGLVSILSTLTRICVMVPTASVLSQEAWLWFSNPKKPRKLRDLERSEGAMRGVLGSLVFISTSPRRITASLAALVTLLSLAFGTFTQQLLANEYIDVTDLALLPGELQRGETYVYHEGDPTEPAPEIPQSPVPLRAAVYNGMMTNISQLTSHCPTGNCTWPVTTSLAVCGACSPSKFTQSKSCNFYNGCNYTFPDGSVSSFGDIAGGYNTVGGGKTGFQLVPSSGGHIYNTSSTGKGYIANFFTVGYSMANFDNPTNFSAYECALWWCVNAYKVSSHASVQTTAIVYTQDTLNTSGYPQNYATAPNNPGNDVLFYNLTFPLLSKEIQTQLNLSAPAASINYSIMTISFVTLQTYMKSLIQGTGVMDGHATSVTNDIVKAIWTATSEGSVAAMEDWIASVALSLSNYIRDPSPSTFVAVGSQARPEDFAGQANILGVVVRWPWFVLPVVVVAISIMLLVAIIVQSAGSPVGVWKGSWLMYLFCELSPDIKKLVEGRRLGMGRLEWSASDSREDQRGNTSVGNFVGDVSVRLTQGEDGGWTFDSLQSQNDNNHLKRSSGESGPSDVGGVFASGDDSAIVDEHTSNKSQNDLQRQADV